ncbi:Hydroxyacid oxidase 1 [Holothuria leucospilota]|uniref:(S)-2-hydroxy-acid oxidase n=1 Tax=Holothuria leucospilota TaxID=206669 RepID=A0A9Q1CHP1_HOLLE|nr:Hydroxyacid oxidase 1 [Holothuria leucospilota]
MYCTCTVLRSFYFHDYSGKIARCSTGYVPILLYVLNVQSSVAADITIKKLQLVTNIIPGGGTRAETMADVVCLRDLEKFAERYQAKWVRDYYTSGANSEQTLSDNVDAFKRIRLCPQLLKDVSNVDLSTTLLGEKISFPVAIAPTGMQSLAHPQGEVATAKAAASMQTGMILSTWSNKSMEEVVSVAPSCLHWFQLYIVKDGGLTASLVKRAEKAGYKALVVTVDTPVVGLRLPDLRNGFQVDSSIRYYSVIFLSLPHLEKVQKSPDQEGDMYGPISISPAVTWKDIEWLKQITSLPIVLKGILTAEDAKMAVKSGVAGIIVSNHGGRQLDGVLASIDALPEVVEAVKGTDVEVYLDGGVRQGTDVLKALALGARAVFVGRPALWGLTYKGEEGVHLMLEILKREFSVAMALSGCTDAKNIPESIIRYLPTQMSAKL